MKNGGNGLIIRKSDQLTFKDWGLCFPTEPEFFFTQNKNDIIVFLT